MVMHTASAIAAETASKDTHSAPNSETFRLGRFPLKNLDVVGGLFAKKVYFCQSKLFRTNENNANGAVANGPVLKTIDFYECICKRKEQTG